MERKRFPIGVENFEALITGGYLYVDKTRYVHDLLSSSKYYLLCRPRRFGKSLLLSTLEAFFLGKRNLFDDDKIGLNFSSRKRNIDDWKIEEC